MPYEIVPENPLSEQLVLGASLKGYVKVPVLMYHNIAPIPGGGSASYRGLFVSPYMFEQQMKYLRDNGYKALTTQEFFDILKSGVTPRQKSVLITFDDGSRGQYKYAYPILKKYKLKGVFYIITDKSPIKMNEVRAMARGGMIIDSHTSSHPDLRKVPANKNLRYQITTSKKTLEHLTKQKVVSIAYPGCVADSRTFKIASAGGYLLGFSCGRTIYHKYSNRYYLSRVHVYSDMASFKRALTVGL